MRRAGSYLDVIAGAVLTAFRSLRDLIVHRHRAG